MATAEEATFIAMLNPTQLEQYRKVKEEGALKSLRVAARGATWEDTCPRTMTPIASLEATSINAEARRGVSMLTRWFNEHVEDPYPTTLEKQVLASNAHMSVKQVNDWFTNHRKRHWPDCQSESMAGSYIPQLCMSPPGTASIAPLASAVTIHGPEAWKLERMKLNVAPTMPRVAPACWTWPRLPEVTLRQTLSTLRRPEVTLRRNSPEVDQILVDCFSRMRQQMEQKGRRDGEKGEMSERKRGRVVRRNRVCLPRSSPLPTHS